MEPTSGKAREDGSLFGRYRLLDELGSGGMGTVYRAIVAEEPGEGGEGPPAGTRVAVKVLHPHLVSTKDFADRFRREARMGARLDHPNVVRTLDAGVADRNGTPTSYLAMEFVEGQTLRDVIKELGRVPEALARTIARQVLEALAAIHAPGITHRDLKPENVIITPDHQVKVMDLGIAKIRDASIRLSLTGEFLGTIHYAAPEQFSNPDAVGPAADLYAVGILLYEMLVGANPFYHSDFRVVLRRTLNDMPARLGTRDEEVSPVLDGLVWRLLQKSPEARFQSALAVIEVLDQGEQSTWWRAEGRGAQERVGRQLRRLGVARETALVGRETELTILRARFDRARESTGQVVFLEGEAGVGKTRMLDAFAESLDQAGVDFRLAYGTAVAPGVGRPFQAFSEALGGQLDPADPHAALIRLLPKGAPTEAFARYLDGSPGAYEKLSLDAVRSLFAASFRALAAERPLLLAVDDMHLADEETLNLFAYLVRDLANSAILLVCAARPTGERHPLQAIVQAARGPRFETLQLGRLGPRDVAALLREALRNERAVQELGFSLLEKTEGNPYFIFEVLRNLRDENVLRESPDGEWALTATRVEIHVPDTVRELIHVELAKVSDDDRELLEVAAVVGNEFDPTLLSDVLDVRRLPLLRRLSTLERKHRLIRSVGRNCRFDHPHLRETIYAELMPGLREEYHALVGERLLARHAGASNDPAALEGEVVRQLARHLVQGNRLDLATPFVLPALDHLARTYQVDEALLLIDSFADAAALTPGAATAALWTEVLLRRAELLAHQGRRGDQEEALQEAEEAAERVESLELRHRVLDRVVAQHFQRGRYAEAVETSRQALRMASKAKDHERAVSALSNLATALRSLGRYQQAASAGRRALSWILRTQDTLRRCLLLTILGTVESNRGHERSAAQLFGQALQEAQHFGVPRIPAVKTRRVGPEPVARQEFAGLSRALARYAESRIDGERTLLLEPDLSERHRQAAALLALGVLAGHLERLTDARALLLGALDASRDCQDVRFESAVLHALGENAVQARDPELANKRFAEALALRRKIAHQPGVCESLLALGQLAAMGGAVEAARPYLDEAMDLATGLDMPAIAALARATAALLYARSGRRDRARIELDEAQSALSGGPLTVSSRVEGLYFAALASRALDDEEMAKSYLWRAFDILQQVTETMNPEARETFLRNTSPNREILAELGVSGPGRAGQSPSRPG